jgi:hypothetical protein
MPDVLQEACQFHSLAVNWGFSAEEIIFHRQFCDEMVKIAVRWKNFSLTART